MRVLAIVAAIVLTAAAPTSATAQRAKLDSIVRSVTLDNGLQVIVVRVPTIPFATIEMVFRAGAFIQETPNDAGLAHLIEHMLFRRDEEGSIGTDAARIEAVTNGSTDAESVRYFYVLPSKRLKDGIELMARMVRKPTFNAKALEDERKVVQGELERRASDPDLLMVSESDQLLWGNRAWDAKSTGGTIISLNAATPDRLSAIYKRFYVPNNAALIISGDVVDTAVVALATKAFGDWKRGPDPMAGLRPVVIEPLPALKRSILTSEVKDVSILVRWHGPSIRSDPAGTLAAGAFAGLINQAISKTQRRLVDGGLVDELSVSYSIHQNVGPIELMARTSPERAVAATQALNEELTRIISPDFFDAEDLVLAKKWQKVAGFYRLESSLSAAQNIASLWSAAGLDYYLNYPDKVDAQTTADVRRFVSSYIAGRTMAVVVMAPANEWTKIGRDLQRAVGEWKVP